MSAEVARIESASSKWDDPEMERTLRATVCKDATPAQFRMFAEICKATGLNPFLKEIWFVPGVGVMAGRDGYLRVANEHPMFDGMETRVERDPKNVPIRAICSVWRKDRSHPITCEAYFSEYSKGGGIWAKYPSAMISKVAEVLALKRSFSINGVVTEEEIGHEQPTREDKIQAAQEVAAAKLATLKGDVIDIEAEPPLPPPPPTADESAPEPDKFKMLEAFADLKKEFQKFGAEPAYYEVLLAHGFAKSNLIKPLSKGKSIYREMSKRLIEIKAAAEPQDEQFAALVTMFGEARVIDCIAREFGVSMWDEIPARNRDKAFARVKELLA